MNIKISKGFTLIELMIVVVVIGVLAALAIPAYQDYVTRARRADAKAALLQVQLAEEKWRANNSNYGSLTNLTFADPFPSPDGHYSVTVTTVDTSGATPSSYAATATPVGTQLANDTECANFVTNQNNDQTVSGTLSGSPDLCWQK